jgi:phosphopantetheinyl transferase (holo-ACP synthase)
MRRLCRKWRGLQDQITATFAPIRAQIEALPEERRWLVTSEAAFSYLAADFGLKEASIWAINADSQGSPQQVRSIIDLDARQRNPGDFGKSTLFKSMMGFVPLASGSVSISDGAADALKANDVAYVPQAEEVDWNFPVLVEDVVMMGRYGHMNWLRMPSAAMTGRS